jgi:hypothetical protein
VATVWYIGQRKIEPTKALALVIEVALLLASLRTAMDRMLPLRFKLRTMFGVFTLAAVIAALFGYGLS